MNRKAKSKKMETLTEKSPNQNLRTSNTVELSRCRLLDAWRIFLPFLWTYHSPPVRNAAGANPEGIVSSSPGLRACELPCESLPATSLPQRGCGRHPRTHPPRGYPLLTPLTHTTSSLEPLGFA